MSSFYLGVQGSESIWPFQSSFRIQCHSTKLRNYLRERSDTPSNILPYLVFSHYDSLTCRCPKTKEKECLPFILGFFLTVRKTLSWFGALWFIACECPLHYFRLWRIFERLLHQNMPFIRVLCINNLVGRTSNCQYLLPFPATPNPPIVCTPTLDSR